MPKEQQNKPVPQQGDAPINEEQAAARTAEQAAEVMDLVKEQIQAPTPMLGDPADIVANFKGLPMDTLIAAPLIATAEAQQKLTATAWDFYQKIAFESDKDGTPTSKARVVEFDIQRPVQQNDGTMTTMPQKVSAPFVGLVPIPSLLVDHVDVDFQMEVTDTQVTKQETKADADVKASAKWFLFKAELNGKVSTARENTRTTNQTAKYQVHVSASQQPPTEGLSKLMDIMASCVEPLDKTNSDSNSNS